MRNIPESSTRAVHAAPSPRSIRSIKAITAIALAATLGLSSAAIVGSPVSVAQAAGTRTTQTAKTTQAKTTKRVAGDSADYIADKFPGVGSGSVFDVVTYERLVKSVLRKDGKSVIVLGSPRNASTKAALPEINKVAKAKGIEKIYFFAPHLGGDEGKDGADIVWDLKNADTQKTLGTWALWGNGGKKDAKAGLKDFDATNKTAQLKYADDGYASDDTLLLVFDRDGGEDSAKTIAAQDLLKAKDADAVSKDAAAYGDRVAKVFDDAGVSGGKETRYGQYDFFADAFAAAAPKVDAAYGADYYRKNPGKFKLQSVTAAELIDILKTPGTHNVLVSGSWCIDSKHAIGYVSENATRFDSGPVYVFDFRTDGRVLGLTDSYFSSDTAGQKPSAGWIGNEILTLLGKNLESGTANGTTTAFPDGDPSKQPVAGPKRVRSPFLAQVKTDKAGEPGEVIKNWIHVLKNYELPWNPYVYDKEYGIGEQAKEGDLLDYELASGNFTEAQRALGRAQIGEFFSGTSVQSSGSANPPQAYVSRDDSGCGDTNDTLDNVPGDKLLQYQGTDVYDAKHYDIAVDYDPAAADQKSNVTGTTTITATATTDLKAIPLDFREQKLDKSGITVTAGGTTVNVTSVSGVHDYSTDYNKISLRLGSTIAKGTDFTVTVPYSTGILDAFLADGQASQGFFKTTDGQGIAVLGEPLGSTYWFPNNNTPSDGATYEVSLTAPSDYTAVSAGVRKSVTNNEADGTSTTVWKVSKDTAAYQEFAYISRNVTTLGGSRGDADAKAADPDAQQITVSDGKGGTKVIPGLSFVNKTTYDANENRNRDKADTYFNKLPYYIGELEKIAGAYPGESAGFVFDDLSDGTGASANGIGLEGKDRPVLAGSDFSGEQTLIHEYVHQWFGDTARPAAWEDLWLNEAFATYVTDQYYENTSGLDVQGKWKKLYDDTAADNAWWQYPVTGDEDEADLFGGASAAYNRGALALAALRATVGDEKFREIERTWVQEHQGQAVTTAEFVTFASGKAGVNLNDWAKTWLYGTSKPAAWPDGSANGEGGETEQPGNGEGGQPGDGEGGQPGDGDQQPGDGSGDQQPGDGSGDGKQQPGDGKDGNTPTADTGTNDGATVDHPRAHTADGRTNGVRELSKTGSATASIVAVAVGALIAGAALIKHAGRSRRRH